MADKKTILILGGGVGGQAAANALALRLGGRHRVVLVEKEANFAFSPSFLWLLTGQRTPERIQKPLVEMLRPGVELVRAEATAIRPAAKTVETSLGGIKFDYLVISLGAELAPEKVPGFSEGAFNLYALEGSLKIADRLRSSVGGREAAGEASGRVATACYGRRDFIVLADMIKTSILCVLTLLLVASQARAVLPLWNPGASSEDIQAILRTMRTERARIQARPVRIGTAEPVYQEVFASVDRTHLQTLLKDMSGVNPVSVGGETFTISDRYLPASKANYRKYWANYFQSLGIPARELAYPTAHNNGERQGHNVEAVLRGSVPDSVVIIVHYDSIGPNGADNPGADDDMSGMATLMETARILAARQGRLHYTVRFVAADYEEWSGPGLEGARHYARYIQALSRKENFKIVAAVDNEQSGWNEGRGDVIDVFSCGGATDSTGLGDLFAETAALYSRMRTARACMGENSDHYAMWEIGVPAVVFSEHDPFDNPHFDREGGDRYDAIDQEYLFRIAQVGVTFAARLVGLSDPALRLVSR